MTIAVISAFIGGLIVGGGFVAGIVMIMIRAGRSETDIREKELENDQTGPGL